MQILLETAKCGGIGMCEAVAPDLFEVGDGVVTILDAEPGEDRRPDAQNAVDACPVRALQIKDSHVSPTRSNS